MAKATKTKAGKKVSAVIAGTNPGDDPFANDAFGEAPTQAKKKSSKKDTVPVLRLPDIEDATTQFKDATAALKDAEDLIGESRVDIEPAAEEARLDLSRKNGKLVGSVKVNGVLYKTSSRYKVIDNTPENRAALKELFGEDLGRFVTVKEGVSMGAGDLTKENLALAREALPAELFNKLFVENRTSQIVPTEAFHIARTLDPEVAAKHSQAKSEGLMVPYNPSVSA